MATKAGVIYHLGWNSVENNGMEVFIYDNSIQIDVSLTPQTYELTPSGNPLKISIVDNSENKFTPIRSKKAAIGFLNDSNFNYSTFSTGEDMRFYVEALCDASPIFRGWLQQGDIFEPFLYQFDEEVILTAIDGLAYLKGTPLVDLAGGRVMHENRLIDYVAFALRQTGLYLNINVINNLRDNERPSTWQTIATFTAPNKITVPMPGYSTANQARFFKIGNTVTISGSASNNGNKVISTVNETTGVITITGAITTEARGPMITFTDVTDGGNFYSVCYLEARTFEDKLGTLLDGYTILEKILGQSCFIQQFRGDWWIVRVKELRNDFIQYVATFDNTGALTTTSTRNIESAIGLKDVNGTPFPGVPDAKSFFSLAQTTRTNSRPFKSYELDFNFALPIEILCNMDFSRGTVWMSDLPDEIDDDGVTTLQCKKYLLDTDCWLLQRGAGPTWGPTSSEAYVKKRFYYNYEKDHWCVLTLGPVNPKTYIESEGVPMGVKDKFNFSFDWSVTQDVSGGSGLNNPICSIWLSGDDGSFWKFLPNPTVGNDVKGSWVTTSYSDEYGLNTCILTPVDFSANNYDWVSINVDAPPLPVSGKVRFRLHASGVVSTSDCWFDIRLQNIALDYYPFIGGGYANFSGQYFKTTLAANYKTTEKQEIFICNSPKPIYKGSLLKKTNVGTYVLCNLFYDGQEYLYANDGENNLMAYGEQLVRACHNQYRNGDEMYRLTAQGLGGYYNPNPTQRMFNRDNEPTTNNKAFMIVGMSQDWNVCEWSGTMILNFDSVKGYVKDDPFEFKLITQ